MVQAGRKVPFENSLCSHPKTLQILWEEWEFGVGGRRAAKTFNASERGAVTTTYFFQNPFWHLCSDLIERGYEPVTAIKKIYHVYVDELTSTKVLKQINKDKRDGVVTI